MAVGTSNYPTSLDTVVELIQAANNAQTTLNGDLTASATTVAVISTALFANTGCFAVDNELISYTGKTATTFTGCVRGFDGTTPATHSSGSTVSDVVTTAHHEVLVSTILALQQKLGTGNSNPSAGTVLRGTGAGSSAYGTLASTDIDLTNAITNAMVSSSAAIAYSKLNLANSIVNADINASAAIAYSKLALSGAIVDGDISGSAAIAYSKLALTSAVVNADISATAAIAYSKLALSGAIVNADVSASAAIAYSKLALTGTIVDGDISASAAIAYSKLATMAVNRILASDADGKVSASSLTWNSGSSIVGAIKGLDLDGVTTLPVANRILWNSDFGTLMLGLTSAVSLPVGQQEVAAVKSSTNGGLIKGKVVYVVGSTGDNKTVAYAQANASATTKTTLGVVSETVSGSAKAFTTTRGMLTGLNTSALTEGQVVFLSASSAGDLTSTPPTPPNHRVKIGYCVRQHANQGVLFVDVQTGYDVGELCDVAITGTPAAGSLLIRNATAGTWVNATLTAGSGVSVTNGDGSITIAATGAAAGSAGDYQINSGTGFAAGVLTQSSGRLTATPTAVTSGVAPFLRVITPADTGLTASTEAPGIVFGGDGSGSTVTRERAAGAVTTQREYVFTAPTYAAASATTITTAATLAITGAPVAGSNVTLTNRYALLVETGDSQVSRFQGNSSTTNQQIQLFNANASGVSGIAFLNNLGIASSLLYNKSTSNTSITTTPTGTFSAPGGYNTSTPNLGNRVGLGYATVDNNIQLRISNTSNEVNVVGLSLDIFGDGSFTRNVNSFQVRDPSFSLFTVRYALFHNATETRSRLGDKEGGQQTRGTLTQNVTLDTNGATTDTTIQIPANSLVLGVTVRVTTAITGIDSTALEIGDATTSNRFGSIAAFTSGTTGVGLNHLQGGISTDAAGPIVTSATAVRLTLSGGTDDTPSAGAVRVTIHYLSLTAPTS